MHSSLSIAFLVLVSSVFAQSSCGPSPSGKVQPSVASGYRWQVVATGLNDPRGLAFDSNGNLLVVEAGKGYVTSITLDESSDGCVSVKSTAHITDATGLNHGIAVSEDGKTLYASNTSDAMSWAYDAGSGKTSDQKTLVTNMTGTDHSTRTLLLSKFVPGTLLVSFGSMSNLDLAATEINAGPASVKAFDLNNWTSTYTYQDHGLLLGWGLRNDVGVAEHPVSGGIWTVENSADQITRDGVDVHADNPAEELNFLGYLNGTKSANQGSNFGYPWCFSAFDPSVLPDNADIKVGTQFAINESPTLDNENKTDAFCATLTQSRLVFHAHMAPLDIKFNNSGTQGWITFHGSWNSPQPVGYKLSVVEFDAQGEPVDQLTSTTAATDIFTNMDNSVCPDDCFRPATMALDTQGRIFMSSDSTGEIYMIAADKSAQGTPTSSGAGASPTKSAAGGLFAPQYAIVTLVAIFMGMMMS